MAMVQCRSPMRGRPLQWQSFLVALGTVVLSCAILWTLAPPRYDTNDDVAIRLRLEGLSVPGQPPTGFVVLSHAALGWTLVLLGRVIPAVHWWDVVVAGTLLWAIAALLALAWNALGSDWLARGAAVVVVLVATLPLVSALQYTISATLAGGTAVLLMAAELTATAPRRRSVVVMALTMLVVATLVRPMGALAGAASATVFLLPLAAIVRGPGVRAVAVAALTALVIYGGAAISDGWLYRFDRPWQQYAEYNDMLARLFEWGGNLTGEQSAAMRASAGWSKNDWDMLPAMWGVDPDVHGYARLRRAYDANASLAPGLTARLRDLVRRAVGIGGRDTLGLLRESAVVLVAALVLVMLTTGRGVVAGVALAVLFVAACVGIEAAFKTLPFRVIAPIEACLAGAMVLTASASARPTSPAMRVLALGLLLGMLTQQGAADAAIITANERNVRQVDDEVEALRDLHPSLVVFHADAFPAEIWWRPFRRPPVALPAVALGWNNQSPHLQAFLTATGRQPLLRAMCTDPSVVVVAARPDVFEPVDTYMREHAHLRVGWTRISSGSFSAWRCTTDGISGSGGDGRP